METLARSIPQFGKNKYLTNILQIAITEFAYPCQNFAKVIDLQLTIVSRAQAVVHR